MNRIHLNDARRILDSGEAVDLIVWKMATGEILTYNELKCFSSYFRGGTRKLRFVRSNEIREVRDVCIWKINGMEVFL